jgi:hypothetical protein
MRRPWYLNRGLVVLVLTLFPRASIAPDRGWVQTAPRLRLPLHPARLEIIEWCTTSR